MTILIAGFPKQCQNYQNAIEASGYSFLFPTKQKGPHPFVSENLSHLSYDLLLLPGGGDISPLLYGSGKNSQIKPDYITDLLQFQLLQLAVLQKKPVLGICKGMQLINVYFGGSLWEHLPTADAHKHTKKDKIHPIFFADSFPSRCSICGKENSFCHRLYQLLNEFPYVNSAHHQGIRHLGNDLVTLQYTSDYLPETIAHRHLPILATQWHPERLENFSPDSFRKLLNLLLQNAVL